MRRTLPNSGVPNEEYKIDIKDYSYSRKKQPNDNFWKSTGASRTNDCFDSCAQRSSNLIISLNKSDMDARAAYRNAQERNSILRGKRDSLLGEQSNG